MIALIQRVKRASVEVDNKIVGKIDCGYLVFLGVFKDDEKQDYDYILKKLKGLRVLSDENGKMNKSIKDNNCSYLIVSQFTLCAETRKGNRPSFTLAASPGIAKQYYDNIIKDLKEEKYNVETGIFGADMQVSLINDGPVTIIIDSKER